MRCWGQVALFGLPLLVELHEHRSGEAEQGVFIGEQGCHTGAALDLAVESFEAILVRSRRRCSTGKSNTVRPLGMLASSQAASLGATGWYLVTISTNSRSASARLGALNTPRNSALASSCETFGGR